MLCQRCTFCEDYEVRYISRLYTLFLLFQPCRTTIHPFIAHHSSCSHHPIHCPVHCLCSSPARSYPMTILCCHDRPLIVLQVSCFSLYYPVAMIAHSHHPPIVLHLFVSVDLAIVKVGFFPITHPASFPLTLVPETMPFWLFVLVLLKYKPSLRSIVTIPDFLLGRAPLF